MVESFESVKKYNTEANKLNNKITCRKKVTYTRC